MPLFAKGCADPAIIATLTARTLFLNLTIAVCWIKPLLSAMVAVKRIPAASIKPTTAHPLHTGNIKPSLWNQEQVLTFRLKYNVHHNHPEIALSEKTLYNYIESGALSVKNIDLPKKVKYKVRSCSSSEAADLTIYEGRTYKDYQAFLKEFPDTRVTEMDTVLGCEGSKKVLLTLHFDCCSLMMAYLLDSKEVCHVKAIFDSIERSLGTFSFSSVFSLVLTDRGGEFRNPAALECGQENLIRTSIYYCDPMCSWQKPHCEKNHEYIRKICPKGTSFDDYSQEDITLMMSHINSSPRQSLGGMSPLKLAKLMLPSEVIDYFGLTEIPDDEIVLTPALLQK